MDLRYIVQMTDSQDFPFSADYQYIGFQNLRKYLTDIVKYDL